MKFIVRNDKGEPIVLNEKEQALADALQRKFDNEGIRNALGFDIDITTLTAISKRVTEQKFFQIAPGDYLQLRVGNGAWADQILTYRSFSPADDFSDGIIQTGGNNSMLAEADTGVDSLAAKTFPWAKRIGWSLPELAMASRSGNWDLVTSKEKSRKTNWDLGIQKTAFLGLPGNPACLGLFTQSGIATNTTIISQYISTMGPVDLKAFVMNVVAYYRTNCNRTAWPTHFTIPENDYLGLTGQASAEFPIKSTLELLEEMFKAVTRNKNFKILPCAYGDLNYNGLGLNYYALYNGDDEESLRMDIPVDYTNTLANSLDNFQFQNTGFGQFTGVLAYRPLELVYFTNASQPVS